MLSPSRASHCYSGSGENREQEKVPRRTPIDVGVFSEKLLIVERIKRVVECGGWVRDYAFQHSGSTQCVGKGHPVSRGKSCHT